MRATPCHVPRRSHETRRHRCSLGDHRDGRIHAGRRSGVPGILYAEQPTGIEIATYLATWPALEPEIHRLQSAERAAVMHDLAQRAAQPGISDGALNLLAQLQREDGALDDAEKSIGRAIAVQPKQFLHHFQHAMIQFAHLIRVSGLGRWGWQRKTTDAYQRTFELSKAFSDLLVS